jgi:nondiscriminating glutamyl-tRNA synthetase
METIRTRFAPSPTGSLHIGNIRTALFNWLFTRKMKGTVILRIEDTDITRSTKENVNKIIESLLWLGLDWDEGPYFQSERLNIYQEYANKLINEGKAYYCYCTDEELEEKRNLSLARGEVPKYDGKCRNATKSQIEQWKSEGRKCTVRFKLPEESIEFNDIVKGKISFSSLSLGDFVIIKSDGTPTYNFACCIDDHLMRITHVIRGEDHLTNTARQIFIYKSLGFEMPKFAHLPMIFGDDHTPLSKRHGATSIEELKNMGYLKEGIINYLALLN